MAEFIKTTLAIAGAISVIGGAVAVIVRMINPAWKVLKRINRLECENKENREVMEEVKETNRLLCKGVMSILENQITKNSVDKLKVVKDEIQDYLIGRT